jgi:hypothetical protein
MIVHQKRIKKKNFFKKSNYSKEDSSSSNEDDDSDNDLENIIFMYFENDVEDYEEEGEVDLEAELIDSLRKLNNERKKSKSLKEELHKMKESSQSHKSENDQYIILKLKVKVEEAKMIEEILRIQVEVKGKEKEILET